MTFLLSLLAAKGLGALIGGLLLLTQHQPGFADTELAVRNDTLFVVTTLEHAFDKNLDQLLESGSQVALLYTATVMRRGPDGQVFETEPISFYHSAVFDPVSKTYSVFRAEFAGSPDTLRIPHTTQAAKNLLVGVDAPLMLAAVLLPGHEYACQVEANLNTIQLEGMEDKELDLNVFWNHRYPKASSAWQELPRQ